MNSNKIKILYVVSTLKHSGPTMVLLGTVKNLSKEKFDLQILTLSPEPQDSKMKEFLNDNIKVESLNLSRFEFIMKGYRALKEYIDQYDPDIIHTSGIRSDIAISKMNIKAKHCMTIHNYVYEDYIAKYGNLIGKIAANSSIKAMKKCDYVICCSNSLRNMYSKILPTKDLYVVQNGVDTYKFKPVADVNMKVRLRSILGIPQDHIVFLSVGSLIKRKDPTSIIRAFKNANYKNKATLILLGDGELMEQCEKESNENIILKGNVRNVNDYLQASDVYISASKSEGLPNSVLEAGSCGLDLILSDIPQHKEIFEDNFGLVEFFAVEDIKMLSVKINKAIEANNREINYNIVKLIEDNFSNNVMSKHYEEMYYLMLNN